MQKQTIFIGFFAHPSKASSDIMQQQGSKAKTPQRKGAQFFFFGNPFFDQFFSKALILHHPLKTVHKKSPQNPIFIGSKKGGQVIDPKVAKLLTLLWPKNGQVIDPAAYIYIYMHAVELKTGPIFAFSSVKNWSNFFVFFCF